MRSQIVALVLLVCLGCSSDAPDAVGTDGTSAPSRTERATGDAPSPARDPAPTFTISTLDGGTFSLDEHRGELPVVLNFWAPW